MTLCAIKHGAERGESETMELFYCRFGKVVCVLGGIALAACVLALIFTIAAELWIGASEKWRNICRAESLIHEYRKNREKFLQWREEGDE